MRAELGSPGLVPVYRRRESPLHAAGAPAGAALCGALALVAILFDHPLVLVAVLTAVALAAWGAGVGPEVGRLARLGVPFALFVAVLNPLVSNAGQTVLVRGWNLPWHRYDITLEAIVYGGVTGVRVLALLLAFALFSAAVDPDGLLRLVRRLSFRSALTAALTTRLVPALAADAQRMGEAARCRAEAPPRLAVARATVRGTLDRAADLAAALEVRGYAGAGRPARTARRAHSRHAVRVGAAAAGVVLVALAGRTAGVAEFTAYPELSLALGPREFFLAGAAVALAAVPFLGRGARLGVDDA